MIGLLFGERRNHLRRISTDRHRPFDWTMVLHAVGRFVAVAELTETKVATGTFVQSTGLTAADVIAAIVTNPSRGATCT
jgi:hypothetical protein